MYVYFGIYRCNSLRLHRQAAIIPLIIPSVGSISEEPWRECLCCTISPRIIVHGLVFLFFFLFWFCFKQTRLLNKNAITIRLHFDKTFTFFLKTIQTLTFMTYRQFWIPLNPQQIYVISPAFHVRWWYLSCFTFCLLVTSSLMRSFMQRSARMLHTNMSKLCEIMFFYRQPSNIKLLV